jgi:phage terminase small subunit
LGKKTSLRYQKFAQNYVIDLNGTRAAIAAGYSQRTANEQASRLLANHKVQAIIDKLNSARACKLELRAEKIDEEVARLAFSNMANYVRVDEHGKPQGISLSELSRDDWAAVQEIREDTTGGSGDGERKAILRTTLKLSDKTKNLELLYRRLGLLKDNVKVTGMDGLAEAMNAIRKRKHGDSDS